MFRWVLMAMVLCACRPNHAQMTMNMGGPATSQQGNLLRHDGSGTDLGPESNAPPMLMNMAGHDWMLMLHGTAFAVEQQQIGLRGHDKFFSANWLMPMAQRSRAGDELTFRTMISLEPATITGRYYPELFQQGETAYGRPIVDGQHPHNMFMEVVALYDRRMGEHAVLSAYGGPVGDPALGPEAFPHRASASENPLAPLGHHLQDSTHIAYEVVTVGISLAGDRRLLRLEGSGFHGREPDENRWHIEVGAVDSWAARLTAAPGRDWVAQYSLGRLHSPEALHSAEDVLRQTASITYHHAAGDAILDAMAIWGRNHTVGTAEVANGFLLEGTLHFKQRENVWTRIENVDRTTDLLGATAPPEETVIGRVQAYTAGYSHQIGAWSDGTVSLGAQWTGYTAPSALISLYGHHPQGVAAVLKVQLGRVGN